MTDDLAPEDEAALVALVDGRLSPEELAALEERAASDEPLAAALERQRRGSSLIAAAVADVYAPQSLRLEIDRMSARSSVASKRRRRGLGWFAIPGLAGAAAAAAFALVVFLGGGLTVADVAAAADKPPAAAVSPDPAQPALLQQEVGGVRFPNYLQKFGWQAVGSRTDTIDGRATETVFYEKNGKRIAYSIVDGEALDRPDGQKEAQDGVEFRVLASGGRQIVTWERGGHTCVLSSLERDGILASELFDLAAWKGMGAVRF